MNALWLALAAMTATAAGGLLALRLRERAHWVLGFSAGILLGVVAFELLPESVEQSRRAGGGAHAALLAALAGFVLFHALQRLLMRRHAAGAGARPQRAVGVLSSLALVCHSLMDGVGIGVAFQVSPAVGVAVAGAVIAHDFCDGLNVASLMLLHRHGTASALAMVLLDAIAPVIGAAATLAFSVPPALLAPYLGLFAGFLLSIGALDILPQALSRAGPAAARHLVALAGLGAASMVALTRFAA